MEAPTEHPPGVVASSRRLWRTILAMAENRIELLLVELEEERRRAVQALLMGVALGALGLMTLLVATFSLVFVVSEEDRAGVLLVLSACYALATAAAYWRLHRLLGNWSAFSASLAEFRKDKAWMQEEP
jgi:uncharacterized membrane protein YqjE